MMGKVQSKTKVERAVFEKVAEVGYNISSLAVFLQCARCGPLKKFGLSSDELRMRCWLCDVVCAIRYDRNDLRNGFSLELLSCGGESGVEVFRD